MKTDLWKMSQEYDTYYLDSTGAAITFGYPVWEKVIGYIGYRYSVNDVTDVLPTPPVDQGSGGRDDHERHPAGPVRDTRTMRCSRRRAAAIGSMPTWQGRFSAATTLREIQLRLIVVLQGPALRRDLVFSPRFRIGYIQAFEGKESRVWERYILGDQLLRGLKDIGPRDPVTGDILGGDRMLLFNFEFVFPSSRTRHEGGHFFDTGTLEQRVRPGDMRKTTGAGIRGTRPSGRCARVGYVLDRKEGSGVPLGLHDGVDDVNNWLKA